MIIFHKLLRNILMFFKKKNVTINEYKRDKVSMYLSSRFETLCALSVKLSIVKL